MNGTTTTENTLYEEKVIILGAAGRDFHDFMTYWSIKPHCRVVCFTETQIPGIEHRKFPPELCRNEKNGNLYPDGLTIYPEADLEELVGRFHANTCALAYSDLSYDTVQSLASRVNAAGCSFVQLPPLFTQLISTKPVVAICATRTGTGKSQTTRYVAQFFKQQGKKIAAVRHPMPYDHVLLDQRCQRYESKVDLEKYRCTIEEREEYELHIEEGNLLFAGVDYEMILREAEKEADIILWDGGNNDTSFFRPDLLICVSDALRADHAKHFYPGELNVRLADLILINKVNALSGIYAAYEQSEVLKAISKNGTPVLLGNSIVRGEAMDIHTGGKLSGVEVRDMVHGKRVLVIDDGPTLTHGGMPFGAGFTLAKQLGAKQIVDPRPYAAGSLVRVFEQFKHLDCVLPAMGYGDSQIRDLERTIHAADADVVVVGTPTDLSLVLKVDKPFVRARYNLELVASHKDEFEAKLRTILDEK